MSIQSHGHEHEIEPQYGLPELLPAGEHILWQGAPDVRTVALRVFHLRKLAIYFAGLLLLRAALALGDGGTPLDALLSLAWPLPLALTALAALGALAWLTARTTAYTLTDKRVVMRIGIVLTLTFNIPLRTLRGAALRRGDGRLGDIVLQLAGPDHIAFLHLWPHVRPWRMARPEPMLRAVADAPQVAALLAQAWSQVTGVAAQVAADGAAHPAPYPAAHPAAHPADRRPAAVAAVPASAADTAPSRSPRPWQPSPT